MRNREIIPNLDLLGVVGCPGERCGRGDVWIETKAILNKTFILKRNIRKKQMTRVLTNKNPVLMTQL